MSKYLGHILVIFLALFVVAFAATAIKTPSKAAEVAKITSKYKVITDSGKFQKCDSLSWYSYDTIIPTVKQIPDTLRHKHLDTSKTKK
jgi:hypothetical protein